MNKLAFKERMKSLKSYRELNPDKGYWEWKQEVPTTLSYLDGGYVVTSGDTLTSIAKRHDLSLQDLIEFNPQLKNPNLITIGLTINLKDKLSQPNLKWENYRHVRQKEQEILDNTQTILYVVKPLDNLSTIAKNHGLTLSQLLIQNPHITDPDRISIGLKLSITTTKNKNMEAIQSVPHRGNYVILDKANKKLTVYDKNNNPVYVTNNIATGASSDDYNTITYVDAKGNILNMQGNNSTPAGITEITGKGTYHGAKSFTRGRYNRQTGKFDEDIASSIHTGRIDVGSNGCIRLPKKELDQLDNLVKRGTKVYTLPEQPGSKFVKKDNKLSFVADNPYGDNEGKTRYWDDYNTYIDNTYNPLSISYAGEYDDLSDEFVNNSSIFANTLSANKEILQKELGLDSGTYNDLAELAMGIAHQESKFGTSIRKKIKDIIPTGLLNAAKKAIRGKAGARSVGMTQIKLNADNRQMLDYYKRHNITSESLLDSVELAAIATIGRLAHIYNNEVRGRTFVGKNDTAVDPMDALLYKYSGHNNELIKRTATPEKNIYIRNVKKYSKDWDLLTQTQSFVEGGVVGSEDIIGPITEQEFKQQNKNFFKEKYRSEYLRNEGDRAKVNPEFANYMYDFDFDQLNSENLNERKYTLFNYEHRAHDARTKEADKHQTPFIPEKELMLRVGRFNTGRISTNVLDSLYASSLRTGVPFVEALGLAGRESGLGYARHHRKKGSISNTDLLSNWQQILTIFNTNPMTERKIKIYQKYIDKEPISSEEMNFVKNYISNEQKEYDSTKPIRENVYDNALRYYESGKYNPGDSNYKALVKKEGLLLLDDPGIKRWMNAKGIGIKDKSMSSYEVPTMQYAGEVPPEDTVNKNYYITQGNIADTAGYDKYGNLQITANKDVDGWNFNTPDIVVTPQENASIVSDGRAVVKPLYDAATWVTPLGDAEEIYDVYNSLTKGNYGDAALAGVGFVLPGAIGKGWNKLMKLYKAEKLGKALLKSNINDYHVNIEPKNIIYQPIEKKNDIVSADFDKARWNLKLLDDATKFAEQYGYHKPNYNTLLSNRKTNKQVRDILARHNTFLRGVRPYGFESDDVANVKKILGNDFSTENYLKYVATHRRSPNERIWISPEENAFIYGGHDETALVRRPYKLGKNRSTWFNDADFDIKPNPILEGKSWDNATGIIAPWYTPSEKGLIESELLSSEDLIFSGWANPKKWREKVTLNNKVKFVDGGEVKEDNKVNISRQATLERSNFVVSNYSDAKDFNLNPLIYSARKWLKDNFGRGGISNCTLSATSWVDPNNQYMSAKNIIGNPNSGYIEIDKDYALPGDLLISKNPSKENSYHTMLIESFDKDEPILRYSRGGHDTTENLVQGRTLTEYHKLDNEQGGNHTEDHYFRYNYPNEYWLPEIIVTAEKRKIKNKQSN